MRATLLLFFCRPWRCAIHRPPDGSGGGPLRGGRARGAGAVQSVEVPAPAPLVQSTRFPGGADFMTMWFNTAAFTTNAIGTYGNAGRNSLRRPGAYNMNLSLFRHFRLGERLRAEFRAEAFNALNHANFDLFYISNSYTNSADRTSPNFGKITHAGDSRILQLALKLRF